jgi:hypothetical protein
MTNSIKRGTIHFDRDHTKELFEMCDDKINVNCELDKDFKNENGDG